MARTAKRSMYLVFTLFFFLGMTPPQLHAADWTKLEMTSENVKQLAGLTFAGKLRGVRVKSKEIWNDPNPLQLSISDDTKSARFWGGSDRRPYDFKSIIGVRDGMVVMQFQRAPRLFTVERNGAGKFRISAKYAANFRGRDTNYTLVFNQE